MSTIRSLHQNLVEYSEAVNSLENFINNGVEPNNCDETIRNFRSKINSAVDDLDKEYGDLKPMLKRSTQYTHRTRDLIEHLETFTQKREDYLSQYGFEPNKNEVPKYPEFRELEPSVKPDRSVYRKRSVEPKEEPRKKLAYRSEEAGEKTYVISCETERNGESKHGMLVAKYGNQKQAASCGTSYNSQSHSIESTTLSDICRNNMQRYTMTPGSGDKSDNNSQVPKTPDIIGHVSKYAQLQRKELPQTRDNKIAEDDKARILVQRYSMAPAALEKASKETAQMFGYNLGDDKSPSIPKSPPGSFRSPLRGDMGSFSTMDDGFVDRAIDHPKAGITEQQHVDDLELTVQLSEFKSSTKKSYKSPGLSLDSVMDTSNEKETRQDVSPTAPLTPFVIRKPETPLRDVYPLTTPHTNPLTTSHTNPLTTPHTNPLTTINSNPLATPNNCNLLTKSSSKHSASSKTDATVNDFIESTDIKKGPTPESQIEWGNENAPANKAPSASLQSVLAKYGSKTYRK